MHYRSTSTSQKNLYALPFNVHITKKSVCITIQRPHHKKICMHYRSMPTSQKNLYALPFIHITKKSVCITVQSPHHKKICMHYRSTSKSQKICMHYHSTSTSQKNLYALLFNVHITKTIVTNMLWCFIHVMTKILLVKINMPEISVMYYS